MNEKDQIELVARLGGSIYAAAERAARYYENRQEEYDRDELGKMLTAQEREDAQVIARQFLRAAVARQSRQLRCLLDALTDEALRRRRKRLQEPGEFVLGASGGKIFRDVQKRIEMLAFLVREILCAALLHVGQNRIGWEEDEDLSGGGGAAQFLLNTLPELAAPPPREEPSDLEDDEENKGYQRPSNS